MSMQVRYMVGVAVVVAGTIAGEEERHSLDVTNEIRTALVKEVGRTYDKAVTVEMPQAEFRSWDATRLSISLTNASLNEAIQRIVGGLVGYSWSLDEKYDAVSIYKTNSGLLTWNVPILEVTNATVAQVMLEKLPAFEEWRSSGLRMEISGGDGTWPHKYRVTLSLTNVSARTVLNALCVEMSKGSGNARMVWELRQYQGSAGIRFFVARREPKDR